MGQEHRRLFSSENTEILSLNQKLMEDQGSFKVKSIHVVFIKEEDVEMVQHKGSMKNHLLKT